MVKTSHPSNYEVVHCNLYWIVQIHELIVNNLSSYKEPMPYILCATLMHPSHVQYKWYRLNIQINVNA